MKIHDYYSNDKNLIKEYLAKLSKEDQAKIYKIRHKIILDGLTSFNIIDTRQLKEKLWEIKISQHRIMYVLQDKDNIYFLHICKKQKGKAEKFELQTAYERAKELEKLLNQKFI